MNDRPNMADDFVLNNNCATTTDQTLIDQLCQSPSPTPTTLPNTGQTDTFGVTVVAAIICAMIVVLITKNRKK
jgi:LPXTG-motif cell wall-anchored protein